MKITSLKLTNFRGYKNTTEIKFDNLTVFVGKNDIGKSTILEALDIFFNEGKKGIGIIKMDEGDINKQSVIDGNFETTISVCFTDLPEEITIDDSYPTTLANEYLLNRQGQLEIIKRYKNGSGLKVFIKADHPTNLCCADLLIKKNTELKGMIKNESIPCQNQSINAVMRTAIWNHHVNELQMDEIEIDASKEDAKKIWDKLCTYMPIYTLFQSDRSNSDADTEVQDPLKEAVRQILADEEIQNKLAEVATEVETKLKEVSGRTLAKLREMAPDVANSLNPIIPSAANLKWADVFKNVSITGDDDIPINKRGSGVRRLILLNFFRAEAERRLETNNNSGIIYAIEEPETSQHNYNLKLLVNAFKDLVIIRNTQVILTTHSAVMVKQLDYSNLRIIFCGEDGCKNIQKASLGFLRYPSLNEVNYTAFNEITEEYHDELYAYIEFQQWFNEYKNGKPQMNYIRLNIDGTTKNESYILASYIRHQIHHPENTLNLKYTQQQLKQSIDDMRNYICAKGEQGGSYEPVFEE